MFAILEYKLFLLSSCMKVLYVMMQQHRNGTITRNMFLEYDIIEEKIVVSASVNKDHAYFSLLIYLTFAIIMAVVANMSPHGSLIFAYNS